jgi:tripeptide aminopeptidase
MDVSPAVSGKDVKPILHRRYDGGRIVLPGDPTQILDPALDVPLGECRGLDIITSDGTTLLGADDKAGVAIIMEVLAALRENPQVQHGPVFVAFTPDEEIGRGVSGFDLQQFQAEIAYTIDGKGAGEIEDETFCADSIEVTFHGINVHPGYAKGKMVNSIKVAADFIGALPREESSPETTEDRQGYVHPMTVKGTEEKTTVKLLLRDFTSDGLSAFARLVVDRATAAIARYPGARLETAITHSYKNMKVMLDQRPDAVAFAEDAIRQCGLSVHKNPIRGGTDGARLSFLGLPTPNLSAGGFNFHGKKEWAPLQHIAKSAEVCMRLLLLWGERGVKRGRLAPVE